MPAASAASSASSERPAVARAEPTSAHGASVPAAAAVRTAACSARAQRGEAALHARADPVGHRQGEDHARQGVTRAAEAAGRLDDRERIPARADEERLHVLVVQPAAGDAPGEVRGLAPSERRHLDAVDALQVAGGQVLRPRGEQHRDPLAPQPPRGEQDRLGRRRVEPVQVVDGHEQGGVGGGQAQDPQGRGRHAEPIGGRRGRQREGALERLRLRPGQPGDEVGQGPHQLEQAAERELRLALDPPRPQDPHAGLAAGGEGLRLPQEGGLSGARRPDQGERAALAGARLGDEPADGRDLGLPARRAPPPARSLIAARPARAGGARPNSRRASACRSPSPAASGAIAPRPGIGQHGAEGRAVVLDGRDDRVGDLVRLEPTLLADPAEGPEDAGPGPGVGRLRLAGRPAHDRGAGELGPHHARLDQHRPHAGRAELERQRLEDRRQRQLRRAVHAEERHGDPAGEGGDADHDPGAGPAHRRERRLDDRDGAEEVGLELAPGEVEVHVLHRPEEGPARVVHHAGERATGDLVRRADRVADARGVRHVEAHDVAAGGVCGVRRVAHPGHHPPACGAEGVDGRLADAARGARDEHGPRSESPSLPRRRGCKVPGIYSSLPALRARRPGEPDPAGHLMRVSCPAHSCSRSRYFCTLPVEVLGSSPTRTATGHL